MESEIKLFRMSHQMLEGELDLVERELAIDLGRRQDSEPQPEANYYPQFPESVRRQAAAMAKHYEVFYCLERSIRDLIRDKLSAEIGLNWWDSAVPENVRRTVDQNIKREIDQGVTPRSTEKLDYTTFGELGEIVRANWDNFADTFSSQAAFNKIMTSLNVLRGPIAHTSPLAEDEVLRLQLTMRDWFRLMQ
jgi:hypothetical protein